MLFLVFAQIFFQVCGVSFGYHIDPDTEALTITRRRDGVTLDLVMSDEFNDVGRSFANGNDNIFEAIEKPACLSANANISRIGASSSTTKIVCAIALTLENLF